jgi:AraC family transcriptional regulator of adaptative response/methylated-DNA-[protein]-cysteine methyltransferase
MTDYERIARVIEFLDRRYTQQPDLATLAREAKLSPFHFQRLFARWAGITPKSFLQCLTHAHARELLRRGESVLDAALDVGLSGPGRLHDLCVTLESASPGELKSGGDGWTIKAGFADSPFGYCLVGEGPRGICHLTFVESRSRITAASAIRKDWPLARIEWNDDHAARVVAPVFDSPSTDRPTEFRAIVRGTDFQIRVWRALLNIPRGALVSYSDLAESVGNRSAARAVGSAVAANTLAGLIPCHRVIRQTGVIADYRWGTTRKKALLAWETASRERSRAPDGPA